MFNIVLTPSFSPILHSILPPLSNPVAPSLLCHNEVWSRPIFPLFFPSFPLSLISLFSLHCKELLSGSFSRDSGVPCRTTTRLWCGQNREPYVVNDFVQLKNHCQDFHFSGDSGTHHHFVLLFTTTTTSRRKIGGS